MKRLIKKMIKKFLHLFGYEVVRISHDSVGQKKTVMQAVKQAALPHSQEQTDVFKNDFQFNMFVESHLSIDFKRTIIAQTFYKNVGYYPNIDHPGTFSEKVLWLKLYYNDPLIAKCCDKVGVKDYIDEKLGQGYTVPVLKEYDSVFNINLDELPDRFALKVNWATGCNIIVRDKKTVNIDQVRSKLDRWSLPWKSSYYGTFNRGYRTVPARIFAEEYLDIPKNSTEYKVYCFNGKVRFTLVELDYFGAKPKRAYYDRDWKEVPFFWKGVEKTQVPVMPEEYPEIVRIAEVLAKPFPYVRVDFYDIDGRLYVGEMTFYSGGGFSRLRPREWDHILGEELDISEAMERVKRGDFATEKNQY